MEKKKSITKEQIISTALDLMHDKNELHTVNMREIARTLGCAHTNIYNYFPTYSDLLWETHTALLAVFMNILSERLAVTATAELKFKCFFDTLVGVYLDNKGWFRLTWTEYIDHERPQDNIDAAVKTRLSLNRYIAEIWEEMTGNTPDDKVTARVVHNTHCYIVGEISNYISGRGLIENEAELKAYIAEEAMNILTLCLKGGTA